MIKKIFICVLSLIITVMPVFAISTPEDGNTCSFSLDVGYEDASVSLYKIADCVYDDGNVTYTLDAAISAYILEGFSFDGMETDEMLELAETIYNDIKDGNLSSLVTYSATTDEEGFAVFSVDDYGLYLVKISGYVPYLAAIPLYEDGQWYYTINAIPKTGSETDDETETEPTTESETDSSSESTTESAAESETEPISENVNNDETNIALIEETEETNKATSSSETASDSLDEESETSSLTGDEANLTSWAILGIGALIAIVVVIIWYKKKKK